VGEPSLISLKYIK